MLKISRTSIGLVFISFCLGVIYTISGHYLNVYYTFSQIDDANDLNYMIYRSQLGYNNNDYLYNVTWGSEGVMALLKPVIYLFGTHDFTIIIYSIIAGMLVSSYIKLFNIKLTKTKMFLVCFFLIGSLTYIGIPGKGFLTFIAFYFFIRSVKDKSLWFLLLALIISAANRPWESLIFIALKILLVYRDRPKKILFLASLVFGLSYVIFNYLIDSYDLFNGFDFFIEETITKNFGNYQFLRSDNIFVHLVLTPLRILAGFMSLFTSSFSALIESNLIIDDFYYYWWRTFPVASRITSFILFILLIFKFSIKRRLLKSFSNLEFLAFSYTVIYGALITMGGVEEKSRYFLIFPAILLPLLWPKKEI
jgi:uncharacterized membrane protein